MPRGITSLLVSICNLASIFSTFSREYLARPGPVRGGIPAVRTAAGS